MPEPPPGPRPPDRPTVRLRLLATTDLHAELMPWDYHADRPLPGQGLARTATLIAEARAERANVLLFDNGDLLQGNPMADLWAGSACRGPHPVIAAMNALGYDAATVGNHDFDYGLDFLTATLAEARFPVVSANAVLVPGDRPTEDRTLLPPFVLLDRAVSDTAGGRHRLRLGVIGLLPPQVTLWNRAVLGERLVTRDIAEAAAAWVPAMRAAGADLVVALCHAGIGEAEARPGLEDASVPVARLAGVDALVTGHSHKVFPGPDFDGLDHVDPAAGRIDGKPAVMAGARGSHLGVIDLTLVREGDRWAVSDAWAEARGLGSAEPDPTLMRRLRPAHEATLVHARRPIGETLRPLHSHFALVAPSAGVALVAEAQARHVRQMLPATPFAGLPVLSAAAPFKAGGSAGPAHFTEVPVGPLALRHACDLYIYPNRIAAVRLTGAQVADWLERAASLFATLSSGVRSQPLVDPAVPCYSFDLIHGVEFTIDLSQPARCDAHGRTVRPEASRIRDLRHEGRPVDPDQPFVVATNSYRAGGSLQQLGANAVWMGSDSIRDLLIRHIAEHSPLAPEPPVFWRFAPMPGASAEFLSARDPGPPPPHLALTRLEDAPCGFSRFRLDL